MRWAVCCATLLQAESILNEQLGSVTNSVDGANMLLLTRCCSHAIAN